MPKAVVLKEQVKRTNAYEGSYEIIERRIP